MSKLQSVSTGSSASQAAEGPTDAVTGEEDTVEDEAASPPDTAAPTTAPPPSRRYTVAPLQALEEDEDARHVAQHPTPLGDNQTPETQSPVDAEHPITPRQRKRAQSHNEEQSSDFSGVEGQILQVQRLQGRSIKNIQRQLSFHNQNMKDLKEAVYCLNNTVADGFTKMADVMGQMCQLMESNISSKRRDRHQLSAYHKSVDRLCNATHVLSRRSVGMQLEMAKCSRDVTQGLVAVTSALEVLQTQTIAATGAGDVAESEETTSRSSITPPLRVSRRHSVGRSAAARPTSSEEIVPEKGNSGKRARRR